MAKAIDTKEDWPPAGMCCVVYPFVMGESLICQRGIHHEGAHKAIGKHCEYSWPPELISEDPCKMTDAEYEDYLYGPNRVKWPTTADEEQKRNK